MRRARRTPIGNLTSQIFANVYLNVFDHYMKHTLGVRFYGRYTDDFVLVHQDSEHLASLAPQIERFLKTHLVSYFAPTQAVLGTLYEGDSFFRLHDKT